jgi:hypothetical protein
MTRLHWLYVATVLARRLDSANKALIDLKHQVQSGESRGVIRKTVEKMEEILGASGGALFMPVIRSTHLLQPHLVEVYHWFGGS